MGQGANAQLEEKGIGVSAQASAQEILGFQAGWKAHGDEGELPSTGL